MLKDDEMSSQDLNFVSEMRRRIEAPGDPQIPKILHQIWCGENPIPGEYWELHKTWKKYHPDWDVMFWDDKKIDDLNLVGAKYYKKYPEKTIIKADIARVEIAWRYGGVYADHDILYCKSLDPLRKHSFFGVFDMPGRTVETMCFIFGCKKGSHIMKSMMDNLSDEGFDPDGDYINFFNHFSTYYFNRHVMAHILNNPTATVYPAEYLAPFPGENRAELDNGLGALDKYITPNTYAIHLWRTTWRRQFG